jgi:mannitol/fructose-specific phosphotransferase system IIA component (Ntr-type)
MRDFTRRKFIKSLNLAASGLIFSSSSRMLAKPDQTARRNLVELRDALRGVLNFLTTPFHPDYSFDESGLYKNVSYYAQNPQKNMTIVVGGGLGELFTLDVEEQKALADTAVRASQGRLPVVVGAGGGYKLAMRMAANADRAGADAIDHAVELAAKTGHLWDVAEMAEAVEAREKLHPTALDNGVALLHPRRPLGQTLAEPLLALGRTPAGIPFGSENGQLTDIFFLICSIDDSQHLRTLARLSRLISAEGFLDALRIADTAAETLTVVRKFERGLDGK